MTAGRSLLYRDINAPADLLPSLAAARHWQNELILLTTTFAQYDLAVNLLTSLEKLGHRHYILLGDNELMARHAERRGAIACVWSSLLDRFLHPVAENGDPRCPRSCGAPPVGTATHKATRICTPWPACAKVTEDAATRECRKAQMRYCNESAVSFYHANAARRLWLLRYHYTARLIGMQYNVLLLDSDSMVLADPYPYFRSHLSAYTALCTHDLTAWPHMLVNGALPPWSSAAER